MHHSPAKHTNANMVWQNSTNSCTVTYHNRSLLAMRLVKCNHLLERVVTCDVTVQDKWMAHRQLQGYPWQLQEGQLETSQRRNQQKAWSHCQKQKAEIMEVMGFEPMTSRMQSERSTTELNPQSANVKAHLSWNVYKDAESKSLQVKVEIFISQNISVNACPGGSVGRNLQCQWTHVRALRSCNMWLYWYQGVLFERRKIFSRILIYR